MDSLMPPPPVDLDLALELSSKLAQAPDPLLGTATLTMKIEPVKIAMTNKKSIEITPNGIKISQKTGTLGPA